MLMLGCTKYIFIKYTLADADLQVTLAFASAAFVCGLLFGLNLR